MKRRRIMSGALLSLPIKSSSFLLGTARILSKCNLHRLFASQTLPADVNQAKIRNVAIVGGGLAGLSTAYHLLEKTKGESMQLTIIDKYQPGEGGASSVAGGLLHPFSPRGKLIHMGMDGLDSTSRLVDAAAQYESQCTIRDRLYRIALKEANVEQLQKTASLYPELASWKEADAINELCGSRSLGGIELTNGCKVIHVPSYLRGLWEACRDLSKSTAKWIPIGDNSPMDWKSRLSAYDTVVFAAGSGMFHDNILQGDADDFPAELVRGQSIEMEVPTSFKLMDEAVLCGKYITPTIEKNQMLIGATHEYKAVSLSEEEVWDELKQRSYDLCPELWEEGRVSRITDGHRVQSKRGAYGRIPIIGRSCGDIHENSWIFTGLSSRGLIYHGIFGDLLSNAILAGSEDEIFDSNPDLAWWKER